MPHSLVNIKENETKILLINAQNRQQTLSKHTRIGTLCRDATVSIFTTTSLSTDNQLIPHPKISRTRAVHGMKDNSNQHQTNTYCYRCKEHFLSGNDLQKHLRAKCYSDQIQQQIIESIKHIEDPQHRSAIEDILWRNKILFDPIPSIITSLHNPQSEQVTILQFIQNNILLHIKINKLNLKKHKNY